MRTTLTLVLKIRRVSLPVILLPQQKILGMTKWKYERFFWIYKMQYWLSVNFNSKYDGEGIKKHGRPTLNLVVALDISGSMFDPFQGTTDKVCE